MVSLKYSFIKKFALIYISLPLICFFIGWLKWYYAAISCIAVLVCLIIEFLKKDANEQESIKVSRIFLFIVCILAFSYCFYCGIGRLWAQSKDYPWRNAIFRDIILKDWPVIYDKYQGALCYYIGIWLPPSLLGKLSFAINHDAEFAFKIGNIGLLLYSAIGIILLFLLIVLYLKPAKKSQLYLALFMFIFFSGMDILGSIEPLGANNFHLEWWARKYQYSSFTTCMCWVFNQAIIPWICMLLVLNEKKVINYVFIGMCCLLSGPLPFVGLFIYCISIGIHHLVEAIKEKKVKGFFQGVFSLSNIMSTMLIFPFIGLYLLSNASLRGGGGVQLTENALLTSSAAIEKSGVNSSFLNIKSYILFILVEFLVFMILIFRKYKKNYLYYITLILLLLFPFGRVGYGLDFTMRASIPSLLFLYLLCTKYIFEEVGVLKKQKDELVDNKTYLKDLLKRYSYVALVVCLLLGAFTPSVEFIRGIRQVTLRGVDDIMTDYIYTLGEDNYSFIEDEGISFSNFVALDYKESTFFKYFSKID